MSPPVVRVGTLTIDLPAVQRHRFYAEADACVRVMSTSGRTTDTVIGTKNTKRPELYGWAANVDSHVDATGFMYLSPLRAEANSVLCAWPNEGEFAEVPLKPGEVYRLDDNVLHWTVDDQYQVALFVGSWAAPNDEAAVRMLQDAAAALASGAYYEAPRVRDGFRALLHDECYVDGDNGTEVMLIEDAKAEQRLIAMCGQCNRPAVRLDDHFPYHHDFNRCRRHMKAKPDRLSGSPT